MRTPKQFGITVATNGRRFFMDWDSDREHDWNVIDQNPLNINVGSRHGHMQFGGEWPHLPMPKDTWYILDDEGYQQMMAYSTAPISNRQAKATDTVQIPSKSLPEWQDFPPMSSSARSSSGTNTAKRERTPRSIAPPGR